MKKKNIVFILTIAVAMLAFFGCDKSEKAKDTSASDKINIVTTVFAPYDFARQIVGDKAEVSMLLPPASESHSYEPTPQDIINIQNCDVFIYVGGESDAWVTNVLESIENDHMKIVTLMDCVDVVEEELVEGMEEEEEVADSAETTKSDTESNSETNTDINTNTDTNTNTDINKETASETSDVEEPEYDEHVWTSPRNAMKIVSKIKDAIVSVDENNKEIYESNTTSYLQKLEDLDAAFEEVVTNAKRNVFIFADRFPLRYFADAYGLDYFAAFPGCSTDTEPSSATVAFLIDKVKAEQIPVVFHIELSNEKMADTICEATGAKKLLFHACHNVSKEDFENGVTYLDLMTANVAALKEALN